jgi:hypothetical protein
VSNQYDRNTERFEIDRDNTISPYAQLPPVRSEPLLADLASALRESMRYLEPALGPMGDLAGSCVDNGTWRHWETLLKAAAPVGGKGDGK